jgi:hypothetical protein
MASSRAHEHRVFTVDQRQETRKSISLPLEAPETAVLGRSFGDVEPDMTLMR